MPLGVAAYAGLGLGSVFLLVWICLCHRSRQRSKDHNSLKEERARLLPRPTKSDAEYFGGSIQGQNKDYQAPAAPANPTKSGDSRPLPPKKATPPVIVLGPAHIKGAAPPPAVSTAAREKDPPMELQIQKSAGRGRFQTKIVPRSLSTSHLTTLIEGNDGMLIIC
jgi:hypothetical protein